MEFTSLTAAGKLIMMLLCLCEMPKEKDTLLIDIIGEKGVTETIVVKPTTEGYALFESSADDAKKLMDIHQDGSSPSFTVSDGNQKIDLTKIFPDHDFNDTSSPKTELKFADDRSFIITRSGGTVYATAPGVVMLVIHKQ